MKRKLLKNKEEKDIFFKHLKPYLAMFDDAVYAESEPTGFDRKSFGWALNLSCENSQLLVNIVEPKHKLEFSGDDFIRFAENSGFLKIRIKSRDYSQNFEIECHQRLPESGQIRSYFSQLNNQIKAKNEFSAMKACGLLYLICGTFTELIFEAPHLDSYFRDSKRQMMIKVNSSIKGKMGTSFSAQDVAEELGYSIQYLNKVSQDFRALSLNNFINFSKLELFRSRLIFSREKISVLAEECGFPDVNYLIQLFKKSYFITPLQLRKKIVGSSPESRGALNKTSGFERLSQIDKPDRISELSLTDKRCTLIVANSSKETLELYWVSPAKEEVPMTLLTGLERTHIGSAEGHVWMLKRESDSGYFKVGKKNCLIVF